LGVVKKV